MRTYLYLFTMFLGILLTVHLAMNGKVGAVLNNPRVGAGPFTYALLAGQIVSAMVLSHYGWLGSPKQPVTPMGIVGVVVLVIGIILTRR